MDEPFARKMTAASMLRKAVEPQIFSCSAAVKYLLFLLIVFSVLNTVKLPPSGCENVSFAGRTSKWLSPLQERQNFNTANSGTDTSTKSFEANDKSEKQHSFIASEKPAEEVSFQESTTTPPSFSSEQGGDEAPSNKEFLAPKMSMMCEFSNYRYNMCSIEANLKVIATTATVLIIPQSSTAPANTTVWKIRPFTRKWEEGTMAIVKELTIRWASNQNQGPGCDVTHGVPVLIFSTPYFGNSPFHDYTDVLIPLFVAAERYNGKIQFAATNFESRLIKKYMPHLQALSHYPIINLDSETQVHCFPSGQIGLRGNGPLSIDSSRAQNGYTTQEFRQFLRTSLSLKRAQVDIIEKNSNNKPKMVILVRKWTRIFTNEEEIIKMAEEIGFEVIRADTETTQDFPRIAHIINSCDVLMGLHGAGLTNMMYLPNNATVIQIVPWGDLQEICWKDFGEPALKMGLKYVDYEIKIEESTLIEKYPRNHSVFTNPQEIHKQGWRAMHTIFLAEQSVKLNITRFRGVLEGVFNSLTQQQRRR